MKKALFLTLALAIIASVLFFVVLAPHSVRGHSIAKGVIVEEALGSGSVESRRMIEVGFEVTGRVAAMHVDQGDSVSEGQVLARLDDRTFVAEKNSAHREVSLAESTMKRLQADIERSLAVLKGAKDKLQRVIPLVQSGTIPEEDLDVAREREEVAIAELARSRAALEEGTASIAVAQGKLERAQAELERCVIHSPFKGVVTLREREVGDVAVPGSPVLRLAETETVWASVWVDETHLESLRVGLPARIILRSHRTQELKGQVVRIAREVDRETRELLVDVSFDSPPNNLVFGQRVDAWIQLRRIEDSLRLPARFLIHSEGQEGVFVEQAGRARFREVEFGTHGRGFIQIKSGLQAGQVALEPRSTNEALKVGWRIDLSVESTPGNEQ